MSSSLNRSRNASKRPKDISNIPTFNSKSQPKTPVSSAVKAVTSVHKLRARDAVSSTDVASTLLDAQAAVFTSETAEASASTRGKPVEDLVISVLMDNLPDEYSHNYESLTQTQRCPKKLNDKVQNNTSSCH
jgi:hypothetical protein